MSSMYTTVFPSALLENNRRDRMQAPRNIAPTESQPHQTTTPVGTTQHLSPQSSSQLRGDSASPILNHTNTPAESVSTLSIHYQSSDFSSELDEDPFFGANFSNADAGTPSFLDDSQHHADFFGDEEGISGFEADADPAQDAPGGHHYHPLSPDRTPSLHTGSPNSRIKGPNPAFATTLAQDAPPPDLGDLPDKQRVLAAGDVGHSAPQLTPDTGSGRSSDDGLVPGALAMPTQSPRVTVSLWGRDNEPIHGVDRSFAPDEVVPSGASHEHGFEETGFTYTRQAAPAHARALRDETGVWAADPATGQRGLDPSQRPEAEVTSSVNDLAAQRQHDERIHEVDEWLSQANPTAQSNPAQASPAPAPHDATGNDGIPTGEIDIGNETVNKIVDGQTYFNEEGGQITEEDLELMRRNRNWENAPVMFNITGEGAPRYQPDTSAAAMAKFERQCQDNESIVSRAATWGTRRRSLPSLVDIENITSGSFLKKLSIRGEGRRPSILKDLRGLVRKPSATFKRTRSTEEEESNVENSGERRDSGQTLAPPTRSMSWGKKQPVPSINTALVSMGTGVASIGTTHARTGSISTTPVTSPKSPSGFTSSPFASLSVKNTLRRPRSKSEIPKNSGDASHPNLVGMWKKSGGPPVAQLAKTSGLADDDDDDDDEGGDGGDLYESAEMKSEADKLIEGVSPNFLGFQQHVLKLNPLLANSNNYLVDRIAHQQIIRYKSLLNSRVKHLQHIGNASCPCGPMCIALGGSANILDTKGEPRGLDPLSARFDSSDGDVTPLEGAISQESFPQDIPMPPTNTLPAEFECQLCFSSKKFQKPSDWTKHVHEDVQPFTCTWDRCRDPKIFKRKADWVRHENEGHRHLEWWTCDVDECRHICYRRDNFLQHLVREHKFPEPKVKTKAAIKRAGQMDPTWQKVEKCHEETQARPQDEPCRFCGKTFPTWKKLTVHLAKHMEQISLPILKLVARKELDADTIISPVQDPPPRQFPLPSPIKREPPPFSAVGHVPSNMPQMAMGHQANPMAGFGPTPQHQGANYNMFAMASATTPTFTQPFYNNQFESLAQHVDVAHQQAHVNPGFAAHPQAYNLPVTTGTYMSAPQAHVNYMSVAPNVEPFPAMTLNALGLQDPSAGHLGYENLMDPTSAGTEHYTPQGSVSPFTHSPNQGQGGFYQR